MDKQDFNRIRKIAEELNVIRLRNNLTELQLKAKDSSFTHHNYELKWNEVMLLTRGENFYRDCKIAIMKQFKNSNEVQDKEMDYDEYLNFK